VGKGLSIASQKAFCGQGTVHTVNQEVFIVKGFSGDFTYFDVYYTNRLLKRTPGSDID
jgi:hypothetical protein